MSWKGFNLDNEFQVLWQIRKLKFNNNLDHLQEVLYIESGMMERML